MDEFKKQHADVRPHIDSWLAEASEAVWCNPAELKRSYPKASILRDNQVVFNLSGNRYRLLVQISYANHIIVVKKIGTHSEYDKW